MFESRKGLLLLSGSLVLLLALTSCGVETSGSSINTSQGLEREFERLDKENQQNKEMVSYLQSETKTLEEQTNSYAAKLGESFHQLEQGVARATEGIGSALRWVKRLSGKEKAEDPLDVDPANEEAVKLTYWNMLLQAKEFQYQLQAAALQQVEAQRLYSGLELIRQRAYAAKTSFERLQQIEAKEQLDSRRKTLLEEDLRTAGDNNWRVGKEISLYLFGFKWFWGIFTGFAPSTSTTQQFHNLQEFEKKALAVQNQRQQRREALKAELEQNLKSMSLAFDSVSSQETNFVHKNGVLELKHRLLEAFENLTLARKAFEVEESVYRQAIVAGLKEPLKPQVLESWSLAGFDLGADVKGGYKEEIGRVLPPFALDGALRPRADWEKRVQRKVGGGWADELKAFRRANYEGALERLEQAQAEFRRLFDELSEFKNPKLLEVQAEEEKAALAQSQSQTPQNQDSVPKLPMNLYAQVKLFLDRAVREHALIQSGVEEHERLLVSYETEHATVLGDLANYQAPKSGAENELADLLSQAKELDKAQRKLGADSANTPLFFQTLSLLRLQALKARDAYKALIAELDVLEEAKELVRLKQEELATAKRYNWRWGKEIALYMFTFKWLWGVFTGWAPSTNTLQESEGVEKAKRKLALVQQTHATLVAQLRAKHGLEVAKTQEIIEKAITLAPKPAFVLALRSFLINFTKSFDELELARERFLTSFELYRKSMENGLTSYSDFYAHEYADVVDIARNSGRRKTQPSLAADWVLLERERESEQYYKAKEKLAEVKRVFEAVFTKQLEELLGDIAQVLENTRYTQKRQTEKLSQLEEMIASVLKTSGLSLPASKTSAQDSVTPNPSPTLKN